MLSTLRARVFSWPGLVALVAVVALAELAGPRLAQTFGGGGGLNGADRRFFDVCRAHGGTPSLAPGSGDYVKDGRSCEIRFGSDTYEMYAVHPEGFNQGEAALAHRTCTAQAAQARRDAKAGRQDTVVRFVWHSPSGICEESLGS